MDLEPPITDGEGRSALKRRDEPTSALSTTSRSTLQIVRLGAVRTALPNGRGQVFSSQSVGLASVSDAMRAVAPQHRMIETNDIAARRRGGAGRSSSCSGSRSWYSWRHQLSSVAAAGFHAVARTCGYSGTERRAIQAYAHLHLAGDVVGLLNALGESCRRRRPRLGRPIGLEHVVVPPRPGPGMVGLSAYYVPRDVPTCSRR